VDTRTHETLVSYGNQRAVHEEPLYFTKTGMWGVVSLNRINEYLFHCTVNAENYLAIFSAYI
jgi:hypothetical protein